MVAMLTFDEVEIHARRDQGAGSLDDEALAEFTRHTVAPSLLIATDDDGHRFTTTIRNVGTEAIILDAVEMTFHAPAAKVLEHGWQSWSTVRRAKFADVRPERGEAPRWLLAEMAADPSAPGNHLVVDTFVLTDAYVLGALTAARNLTTFIVDGDLLVVRCLLDGLVLSPEEEFVLDDLWGRDGAAGENYSKYCAASGAASAARVDRGAPTGWCSWYHYFGDVTAADVVLNAELAAAHGLGLIQIDDGWQPSIGVWSGTAPRFGAPVEELATSIVNDGGVAGIWTAPFLAVEGGTLATEHPEWLVTHDDGRPVTALTHPVWGGKVYALDTTRDDVCAHLTATYAALLAQGFEYHKIDFCFAAGIPGRRSGDGTMTRGQALRRGLEAVRAGIGDDAYLLGCGAPLLSAVGIVDAMRVSEDVAPFWEPTTFVPGWQECSVAARNAIEQSVLRAPMHRRWFLNDPDCLLLRPTATELTSAERITLATSILGTGAYLIVSDDLSTYTEQEWSLLNRLIELQPEADTVLDLVDPFASEVTVAGEHLRLTVSWDRRTATLETTSGKRVIL